MLSKITSYLNIWFQYFASWKIDADLKKYFWFIPLKYHSYVPKVVAGALLFTVIVTILALIVTITKKKPMEIFMNKAIACGCALASCIGIQYLSAHMNDILSSDIFPKIGSVFNTQIIPAVSKFNFSALLPGLKDLGINLLGMVLYGGISLLSLVPILIILKILMTSYETLKMLPILSDLLTGFLLIIGILVGLAGYSWYIALVSVSLIVIPLLLSLFIHS